MFQSSCQNPLKHETYILEKQNKEEDKINLLANFHQIGLFQKNSVVIQYFRMNYWTISITFLNSSLYSNIISYFGVNIDLLFTSDSIKLNGCI